MCGTGHTLFEKNAACFAEVESREEYSLCRIAASQAMDDAIKAKRGDLDVYFHKLCQIMNDYLQCSGPFVIGKCGPDAWRLVKQVCSLAGLIDSFL
jgi:hypothetical protein